MGCHDWNVHSDAEYKEMALEREKKVQEIVDALRKWIDDGGGDEFKVRRSYFSQYASDPTFDVSTNSSIVSVRIGRK